MNEIEIQLTEEQIKDMQHCLGLDYVKKPYRNYVCYYESVSYWDDLVKKGVATLNIREQEGLIGKYYYYHLTELGIKIIIKINDNLNIDYPEEE